MQARRGRAPGAQPKSQIYDEKLTTLFNFLVTPKQHEKLLLFSDATGRSMGDIMRESIDKLKLKGGKNEKET